MKRLVAALVLLLALHTSSSFAQFSISGTVRNPSLSPVAGVQIVLSDGVGNPIGIPLILTNAAGFYSISPLPPGNYVVGFEPPTVSKLLATRAPVTVVASNVTLNRTLSAGVILSGTVTDTTGVPIPDIDLKVENRITNEVLYTPGDNTDVNGFYDIVIPAGEFDINWRVVAPGSQPWIRVTRREVITSDTVINIQMIIGVFVSGHVTRSGAVPVKEVNLDFIDAATGIKLDTPGDVTDSTGAYQVHIPLSTYRVRAKPAFVDRLLGVELEGVVVTTDGVLDFALSPGVGITGVVSRASGTPEPEVKIEVRDLAGVEPYTPFAVTDLAGAYSIVVPASTQLTLDYVPPVATKLAPVRAGPTAFATDQVLNATVPAGMWLSGTVTNPSLAPVPGVDLDLKDAITGASIPVAGDFTDASGQFQMTVMPGTYTVEVEPPLALELVAHLFNQTVTGDVTIPIQLLRGATVHGTVSDQAYLGIPGYRVVAFDLAAGTPIFTPSATTNSTGVYAMVVPVPRIYRFTFFPGALSGVTDTLVVDNRQILRRTAINVHVPGSVASGIGGTSSRRLVLLPNHPNPFNPSTSIRLWLERAGHVEARVYDARGRLVRDLWNNQFPAGDHLIGWDGRDQDGRPAASGVYFCRVASGGEQATIKMVLLK